VAKRSWAWFDRHRERVHESLLGLLLILVFVQAYLLYREHIVNRAANAQSNQLLNTYMKGDSLQIQTAAAVNVRLSNVRFRWTPRVYIDTADMAVRAEPIEGSAVNFDNPESFVMALQRSTVVVNPQVLEGMFNESVFNYPGSTLRALKVSIVPGGGKDTGDGDEDDKGEHHHHHGKDETLIQPASSPGASSGASDWIVHVTGSVNFLVWLPFTMDTRLSVDRPNNALVLGVEKLKLLGFIPATKLIKLGPFHLDKFITPPPNGSLSVSGNEIRVKPLGLFPPPRVKGQIQSVDVSQNGVRIGFAGAPIAAPTANTATNYVYLRGGTSEFGHIRMADTDVLIADQDPRNLFVFSLADYQRLLPRSRFEMPAPNTVRVTMPDD